MRGSWLCYKLPCSYEIPNLNPVAHWKTSDSSRFVLTSTFLTYNVFNNFNNICEGRLDGDQ